MVADEYLNLRAVIAAEIERQVTAHIRREVDSQPVTPGASQWELPRVDPPASVSVYIELTPAESRRHQCHADDMPGPPWLLEDVEIEAEYGVHAVRETHTCRLHRVETIIHGWSVTYRCEVG